MKKHLSIILLIFFVSCTKNESVDLSQIGWVQEYGFQADEIHKINTTGVVPAPKVPFTIEGITKNCIISLGTYDLVLNEQIFDLQHFEPYRLSNKQIAVREMLLEEGMSDSLFFLNQNFDGIKTYLMKKSNYKDNFSGMIGWQFFQNSILIIDLKQNLMGMKECSESQIDGIDFFTGKNPSQKNNMLKFQCELNGYPITASICTSIRHSFVSPEFLNIHDIDSNSDYITLDSLKVGNKTFKDITCFINKDQLLLEPDNKSPIHFIVGLNEIKQYNLAIDFCNNKLGFLAK